MQRYYGDGNYGYDGYGPSDQGFTDVEIFFSTRTFLIARGRRYGRWWMLKGLSAAVVGNPEYEDQLRNEYELLRDLRHPNIINTEGMEYVGGLGNCIVMEWVDGLTLRDWLEEEPPKKTRKKVLSQILDAVDYIHSKGVVHHDLRASNIMISRIGETPKIVDFNAAHPDELYGPEEDRRVDIYSLGNIINDLDLGYAKVAKRCRLGVNSRYQDVDELREAMDHKVNVKRWIGVAVCALLAIGLGVALFVQGEILNSFRSEVSRHQQEQDEMASNLESLADSLDRVRERNRNLEEEQTRQRRHQELLETTIARGRLFIETDFEEEEFRNHLDTLTSIRYLSPDFSYRMQQFSQSVDSYMTAVDPSFTEAEKYEIRKALNQYLNTFMADLNKRLDNVRAMSYSYTLPNEEITNY